MQGGVGGGTDGVAASGRDLSGGGDGVFRSGLLAGKHDGNGTAYDMKSLGKHIEAVRSSTLPSLPGPGWRIPLADTTSSTTGCRERDTADDEGGDGDQPDPILDRVVLFDREGEHPGPDPQGDHAPPGEPQRTAGAESPRVRAVQAGAVWGAARRGRGARGRAYARQDAARGLWGRV